MAQHTVLIAGTHSAGDPVERWWRAIGDAWPRPSAAPPARPVCLSELITELAGEHSGDLLKNAGPALIALGADFRSTALYQLVDRLQQHMVPAVILMPHVDPQARRLEGGGVLIESWDADPAFLAATLFALRERETTVRGLVRDLAISARYQGGVSGEIDRIHDELNLAAAVQQEMLPRRMPSAPGLEFGVLFRPAGYVSGDIYDVVELDDRHIGFFIADAVGHGVPAALMTMVISRSLRMTRAGERGREIISPGDAMTRLNDELCRGKKDNPRFSTAVYGVIDTQTRRVTLAGAGHPPPLRIRGRLLSRVETDGPLLGVFPGEKFQDTTFTMADDETLLLYSDGFETAFAPLQTGTAKRRATDTYLNELVALPWPGAGKSGTAANALADLAQRIDLQAGSLHQVDDVTAVAICTGKLASESPAERSARIAA